MKDKLDVRFSAMKKFFLSSSVILFLFVGLTNAQPQTKKDTGYSKEPLWIAMMDDPNANYYEALNAYSVYWKTHVMPAGEEEEGEGNFDYKEHQREVKKQMRKDLSRKLNDDEIKKQSENVEMKYQVKRFQQWAREVKPFVQEDGRILSDEQRMEIWKKQQEEIKKQNK